MEDSRVIPIILGLILGTVLFQTGFEMWHFARIEAGLETVMRHVH